MPRRVRTLWRRLSGWRTFVFFTPAFLVALLDALHAIDFRQALLDLGLPESSAKFIVTACFLAALVLRTYTTTPPLRRSERDGGSTLMWGFLAKLLLGLPGVLDGLFAYLNKRSDNGVLTNGQNVSGDVTVAQAQLAAYVEERKVIAAERAAQRLSPWTAWMIPTAFALCMLHFGAIVLDSTFLFGWRVAKLPPPYDQMEWSIVMAVIGLAGIPPIARRIFGR